uniref:hypothetical protein n=1 Tax=Gemmiger formicilis TaxID=745368 RepID=UPI0040274789
MKKLLSLTAAALLLITTGCGRSNAPPASASSGTPSVSAPITEPTVESSDDTTPTVQKDEAAVKPQSSRRLDDSRIIPLYSERFTYTDPNGIEDTYFYEVPQIDDDTEDAKHINEMINYRYGYLVERAQDARSRNDFIDTGFIIWVSNWNGPVLSLQITSSDRMFNDDVGSYHYNFATGQELTNLDLLEYMGYTDSAKTLNALQRATAQYFDLHYGGNDPTYAAELNQMRVQSLSELDNVFTYYSLYPYYTGGLVVTVPMYTPAGSGMYWTDVQVYPDKRQASGQILHGQDEWFTCDVTATGEVTVRALTDYVTPDGAVTYQTMKEWYELGDKTEFAVSGCYGDYIKMLMTSIGQDYAPYVFLLTENGNVEYIDVISGAQCGTMVNGGPLFGINGIVRFETGTAYDAEYGAEYATVYGVSRDNEKFNLMEAVWNTAPLSIPSMIGSFVSEETGTWFEICEDQPNFYTGEYANGQMVPATWDSSISYLGMDDRGWICSVSLFRMDSGRTQRETVAMMPDDYGGINVMHIGGESLLNLPQQESVWFEMTQE